MISKVTLKELYKDTFRRSSLIAIPNMSELLQVPDSEFSKWEVFFQIVKDALGKFELYYPLSRTQRMAIDVDSVSRKAKYYPNFDAYLNDLIDEDDIVLEMATCVGLSYSGYVNSNYPLRSFRFDQGEFTDFWYSTGVYFGNCICKRPLIEDYVRDGDASEPTDKCAVYFMRTDDSQWNLFRNQVFAEVCKYILNIKRNFQLPNMPIELFGGLEEDMNNTNQQLEEIYSTAHKWSAWIT